MTFIRLLGSAGIPGREAEGTHVGHLGLGKPLILLARLIVEPRGFSRETLADFLWPNITHQNGRASLRQALHVIRRALGPNVLLEGRGTVACAPDVPSDWRRLQDAVQQKDDREVIAQYTGVFLENTPPLDLLDADQWVDLERVRLHRVVTRAVQREVDRLVRAEDVEIALMLARQHRALAPDDADGWTPLFTALQRTNDRISLAEEVEALAIRVNAGGMRYSEKAKALLDHYTSELSQQASTRGFGTALRSDDEVVVERLLDTPLSLERTITLFCSQGFVHAGEERQLVVASTSPNSLSVPGASLVNDLLLALGDKNPVPPDRWISAITAGLERLHATPCRIRLTSRSAEDGPALHAIRLAAMASRDSRVCLEVVLTSSLYEVARSWNALFSGDIDGRAA